MVRASQKVIYVKNNREEVQNVAQENPMGYCFLIWIITVIMYILVSINPFATEFLA